MNEKFFFPYSHFYAQKACIEKIDQLVENRKIKRVTDNNNITRYVLSDTPENSKFSFKKYAAINFSLFLITKMTIVTYFDPMTAMRV